MVNGLVGDPAIRPGYEQRAGAAADPRLAWWREARYGMFIHWGLYAQPHERWHDLPDTVIHHWTGEWVQHVKRIPRERYQAWATTFDPRGFDADEWVALARRAGQRYIVLTAKHHDGFCLFRTATTRFNSVDATPFGRDIVAELATACASQGITFGIYYSQTQDWHHPDGAGNDWDDEATRKVFRRYLDERAKPQLVELLSNYGPLGLVWFDTPQTMTVDESRELIDLVRRLQPACLVSGRIGNGLGDYTSYRDNRLASGVPEGDFECPATMNRTWGYVRDDQAFKTSRELLYTLIEVASRGGNYLLNVGPSGLGTIPDGNREPLLEIGGWLAHSGAAIHGTVAGPLQGHRWLRCTARPGTLYLIAVLTPVDGRFCFAIPGVRLGAARRLDDGSAVELTRDGDDWVMSLDRIPATLPVAVAVATG